MNDPQYIARLQRSQVVWKQEDESESFGCTCHMTLRQYVKQIGVT